jgi:hypothetical protein
MWFSLTSGVVWLDPNRTQHRAIVPPVTIQSVSADDKNYEVNSSLIFPAVMFRFCAPFALVPVPIY